MIGVRLNFVARSLRCAVRRSLRERREKRRTASVGMTSCGDGERGEKCCGCSGRDDELQVWVKFGVLARGRAGRAGCGGLNGRGEVEFCGKVPPLRSAVFAARTKRKAPHCFGRDDKVWRWRTGRKMLRLLWS